jgi:hypothetical protein
MGSQFGHILVIKQHLIPSWHQDPKDEVGRFPGPDLWHARRSCVADLQDCKALQAQVGWQVSSNALQTKWVVNVQRLKATGCCFLFYWTSNNFVTIGHCFDILSQEESGRLILSRSSNSCNSCSGYTPSSIKVPRLRPPGVLWRWGNKWRQRLFRSEVYQRCTRSISGVQK